MRDDISEAVAAILAEAEADIAARRPVCKASGRCCKFEAYGHRMYVTGVELLHFGRVERVGENEGDFGNTLKGGLRTEDTLKVELHAVSLPQFFAGEKFEGCPYQVGGLCTARQGRPLGCRVYFCDENAQAWQSEVYEKYHAKLKAVHEKFGVAYRYVEWRAGLRELMGA